MLVESYLPVNLAKLNYSEIHERLKDRPSDELFKLLDERSVKIGDTPSNCLPRVETRNAS